MNLGTFEMRIEHDNKTRMELFYCFYKDSTEPTVSNYGSSGKDNRVFGPYLVTVETPLEVLNELQSRAIEGDIKPVPEIAASKPRKVAT